MISNRYIKELAKTAIEKDGTVNNKIADYALNKLTKKELKVFLRKLRKFNNESTVTVRYEGKMNTDIKNNIKKMFENKKINYERDKTLGGGIMIIDNDMIVNYTIGGILDNKMSLI
jgi:F0F1-type ATP synthase delta subunit